MEIRHEIEVARPPEDVFDFLTDTANFPVVDLALVSYEPTGVMTVGLHGTFVHRRSGITARSTWEVMELVRPARILVSTWGTGYALDELVTLTATVGGTRATVVDTVRPTSFAGRFMVSLSGGIMRRDLDRRARLLKAALEASRSDAGA